MCEHIGHIWLQCAASLSTLRTCSRPCDAACTNSSSNFLAQFCLIVVECRLRSCGHSVHLGTRRCRNPCHRSGLWHSASPDRSALPRYDPRVDLHSGTEPTVFQHRHTEREVWSSNLLSFDQYNAEHPLFCQTGSGPVSFQVRGVYHDDVWFSSAIRQAAEDAIKYALRDQRTKRLYKVLCGP